MPSTAILSFEGIGLLIPIADSMRKTRKFPVSYNLDKYDVLPHS